MEPNSPYFPPAKAGNDLSAAELESKKTFWKRATWISAALSVILPLGCLLGMIRGMRKAFPAVEGDGIADPKVLSEGVDLAITATAVGLSMSVLVLVPLLVFLVISVIQYRSYRMKLLKLSA